MLKARVMNSKEVRTIQKAMKEQFGSIIQGVFYKGSKNRLYLGTLETREVNLKLVNAEGVGLYIGRFDETGFRPSIEGAQLIQAKKGIIELSKEQLKDWLRGFNLTLETDFEGYCILIFKGEVVGPGKISGKKLWNYVPKERRIRRL